MSSFRDYRKELLGNDADTPKSTSQNTSQNYAQTGVGNNTGSSGFRRYRDSLLGEGGIVANHFGNFNTWANNATRGMNSWNSTVGGWDDYTSEYDSFIQSDAAVRKYLEDNKDTLGTEYYNSVMASLNKAMGQANVLNDFMGKSHDYFSQWDSAEDYDMWSAYQTLEGRQQRYSDNQQKLADLNQQREDLLAAGGGSSFMDMVLVGAGAMTSDQWLDRKRTLEDLDAQIAAVTAEINSYESGLSEEGGFYYGSKVLDDASMLQNRPDFAAVSQERTGVVNPSKDDLDAYDATVGDASVALTSGGYYDDDGNVRDANGNIVMMANGPEIQDKLGMYLAATPDDMATAMSIASSAGGNYQTTWANTLIEGDVGRWSYLTEAEIDTYYYIMNTQGQEAAYQYLDDMATVLGMRESDEFQGVYDNASFMGKVGLNIASVPLKLVGGIPAAIGAASDLIGGEYNPYSRSSLLHNMGTTVQSSTAKELDALTGGAEIPWLNFGLGDLYLAGMSTIESLVGGHIGGGAYQALTSSGAAVSAAAALKNQGATDSQIVMGALAAGAAEWVFEKYSIDSLIKMRDAETWVEFIEQALLQGGIEMSEEMFTETANIIANGLIMQSESDWQEVLDANGGDYGAAIIEMAGRVASAGVSGLLSGTAAGSAQQYTQTLANRQVNARTGQMITEGGQLDALTALATEMAAGTADNTTKRQIQKKQDRLGREFRNDDAKNRAVGSLYRSAKYAVRQQNTQEMAKALEKKGFSERVAQNIAYSTFAKMDGLDLTAQEERYQKKYADNPIVQEVLESIKSSQESGYNVRQGKLRDFEKGTYTGAMKAAVEKIVGDLEKETGKDYTVSDDGKTHLISDPGADISVDGIASIKDGKMTVRLNNGKVVDAEDVSFGSNDDALIYATLATMNVSAETANALVKNFAPASGVDADVFALDIKEAYDLGRYNYPLKLEENDPYADAKRLVWNEGRTDAVKNAKREQLKVNAETKTAKEAMEKDGRSVSGEYRAVLEEGISEKDMSESQKMSYQLADQIAKAAKATIMVYNGKNGEWGYYNPKNDMVYLNLNSTRSGKSMMAFVLGHELVHRAKAGSPAKYQAFADFLMEQYGKQGSDIEAMIGEELRAARDHDIKLTRDQAFEEVVADACQRMLLDTDAGKKLARFGAQSQQNRNLVDQIRKWIKEFMDKLREMFRGVDPDSRAAREFAKFDESVKQILADMYVDMTIDAGEHLSVIQSAFGKNTDVMTNEQGEFTMAQNADGSEKVFNLVTWKNGGRETMEATLKREGYTKDEIDAALTIMDAKQQLVEDIANEVNENGAMAFPEQGRINEATLTTDIKDGHAVLSALVSNGDYPVNIDLLMVCKKRKAYQRVINRLCETGLIQQATVDALAIAEINKILGKYGFETACLGCFVESRRLRIQEWAQTIVKEWNSEVKKRNPNAKPFGFGKGEAKLDADEVMQLIGELESGGKKNDQGNLNLGQGSAVKRMGVLLDKVPSLRRTLAIEDLITPDGLSALRRFDGNLFSMVKSRYGSNSPKFVQEFNPYNHELAKYGTVPTEYKSLREYLYAIGGARMQSFSDFIVENWFDYCQIVADLAARKLPMHTYTKEIALAKLFGMTGIKINMSLIPDIDRSMGKEYAGLTRNADGELELIWADKDRFKATGGKSYMQSINFADAVALQENPDYSANVGTIAIGVSDIQIRMMLADPRIRMVIPYHSSGMNPIFADLMGTSYYKDYTNYQNTTVKQVYDSKGQPVSMSLDKTQTGNLTGGFLFNAALQELGDARAAAEAYKKWCADKSKHTITIKGETYTAELTPKFDAFKGEPNYYKLLEDFNPYDCITEAAAPQGDVQQVYPEGFEDILRDELKGQEKYRQKQEKNQAFDKAMGEIERYLQNHSKADTVHYANQHGIKLGAKDKKLNAADKAKLKQLQEEGASFKLPVAQNTPYRRPAYDEWDVSAALDDALDHADQHHDNLIRVGEMPHFITDMLGIEGDFYIYRNHAYENMVSEKQALKDSRPTMRKKKKIHFHDLGKQIMQEAILALENPIMAIADSTEKENPKIVMILPVEGHNDAPLYAAMSFYDDQEINGSFARKPHLVLTVAERGFKSEDGHDGYVDVVNEAVKKGRILSLDKEKMRAYMPVIADLTRVGNIADSTLTDNISRFRKEINAFREKNHINYKLPVGEDSSPRVLLSNALESAAQTDIERRNIVNYQKSIGMINDLEAKRSDLKAQLKEIQDQKGSKQEISRVRDAIRETENRISVLDNRLLRMEAAKPLKDLLAREKARVRQETRDADRSAYQNQMQAEQNKLQRKIDAANETIRNTKSDFATIEKEFTRLVKAYEADLRAERKKGEERYQKQRDKVTELRQMLKDEAAAHGKDNALWEKHFNKLLREYEHAGQRIENMQKRAEQQRESASKAVIRKKLRKVIRDLDVLLNKGTKKKHVKEGLRSFVSEALATAEALMMESYSNEDMVWYGIGTDLTKEEERLVRDTRHIMEMLRDLPTGDYNTMMLRQDKERRLKSQLASNMAKLKGVFERERERINRTTVGDAIDKLAAAYLEINNSDEMHIRTGYHENVYQYLLYLKAAIGGTVVRDMSIDQLEMVYKAFTMVKTTVANANKTFAQNLRESIETLAGLVMSEVRMASTRKGKMTAIGRVLRSFQWNNLKPVYAFRRIGSATMSRLWQNIRKGQDTWAMDIQEASVFAKALAAKYSKASWDMQASYSFINDSGMKFDLTLEEIMSLYAYSKREQAHKHLLEGGFVFGDNAEEQVTKNGITRTYLKEDATAYRLSLELLEEITGKLTDEQKAYANEMQDYLSRTMGEKGNEVSLQLYGIRMFNETHYWPLKSAGQYMERAKEADLKKEQGQINLANAGFSRAVVPEARNPVVLMGFMDTWAGHVNEMSMYHSFVLPMEDFRRVYNFTTSYEDEGELVTVSVNSAIQDAHGKAAIAYIDQLYRDINGGAVGDPRETVFGRMVSRFKKAAVFASASVVIQQPSAIGRALSEIDPKHFVGQRLGPKKHAQQWEELKRYAPVAFVKEMGQFDVGMGRGAEDYLKAEEYPDFKEKAKAFVKESDYRDEIIGRAPALADEVTWLAIWDAVKRETVAKYPDMNTQSEEFLQMAGERFSEVIDLTQVYDSVLARSANMRSKGLFMGMATAFLAEPTTSANMMEDALLQAKRGNKRAARRAMASVYLSVVLNAALVSLVYAARDDDEDETFLEKYFSSFAVEILDGINPLTYYPLVKDIWSLAQGWDVERTDMAIFSDVIDSFRNLITLYGKDVSGMSGDDRKKHKRKLGQAWWSIAESIGSVLGIPLKNVRRDIRAAGNVISTVRTDMEGRNTTLRSLGEAVWGDVNDALPIIGWMPSDTKGDKLYDALVRGDEAYAERLMSGYKDENAVSYAITQAIEKQYKDGKIDFLTAADHLVNYAGKNYNEASWKIFEWDYEMEYDDDFQKYGEFFDAVESGTDLDATIKKYLDNGVDEDTLRGQITSHFKPLYMDMTNLERDAIRPKILDAMVRTGSYMAEAEDALYEWDFEAKHGMSYDDMVAEYKEGNITRNEMFGILMERGYTEQEADAKLNDWGFVAKYGASYEDREMAFMEGHITVDDLRAMYEERGKTPDEIDDLIDAHNWLKAHPQYDLYASTVVSYIKPLEDLDYSIEDTGMDIDTFLRERSAVKEFRGDTDENGKSIPYSKINKAFPYIDSLDLTPEQKTALAVACGWSLKTVEKNKLW